MSATPTRLVTYAAVLPIWLTGSWLVADAEQPHRYSPVRQTVSVTAGYAGRDRWIMTTALFGTAVLYLLIASGARTVRLAGRVGLAVCGIAAAGIAACPEPRIGTSPQHLACTAVGAVALAVLPILAARRRASYWAESYAIAVPVTIVFAGLFAWLAAEATTGHAVGLAERVGSSIEVWWPFVLVLSATSVGRRRRQDRDSSSSPSDSMSSLFAE